MKYLLGLATALGLALPAAAQEVPEMVVTAIEAKLAVMECQMDPDDIEVEDDGYELDDVICKGGDQFDIMLDMHLNETGRRAE